MAEQVRVVVVGGGAMGLATAWSLVRRGVRPIVLERFGRGHHEGASHGATRNYNDAYAEDHYLDLLTRAREGWEALSIPGEEPLLRLHGLVTHGSGPDLGGGGGVVAIHTALTARGVPVELMDRHDAERRWPGMRFEDTVLYSPDAGVARASAALERMERLIVDGGGEVRWNTPVARIETTDDDAPAQGASILLASGETVPADVVVVTAGAWTKRLLPDLPLRPLSVTEETPAHFAPAAPHTQEGWPSFNHFVEPGRYPAHVYGMPTPGEGVKVGFHHAGSEVDPDDRPHRPVFQAELADYVREWLPGLDPASAVPISCTYTSTPDSAFVLDRVGSIVVGAGFSGHGFKFTPGVGATLADLALDPSAPVAEPFRIARRAAPDEL
ncbi:FAD-dependent oxidoreductase [Salana multivorans]